MRSGGRSSARVTTTQLITQRYENGATPKIARGGSGHPSLRLPVRRRHSGRYHAGWRASCAAERCRHPLSSVRPSVPQLDWSVWRAGALALSPMSAIRGQDGRQSAVALVAWVSVAAVAVTRRPSRAALHRPVPVPGTGAPRPPRRRPTRSSRCWSVFLIYGRYRQRRRLQDFLLVLALGTLAIANLLLTALPTAVALGNDQEFTAGRASRSASLGTVPARPHRSAERIIASPSGRAGDHPRARRA